MTIKTQLIRTDTLEEYSVLALLDSGATISSISQKFITNHRINTNKLDCCSKSIQCDGTHNQNGPITEYVTMRLRIENMKKPSIWLYRTSPQMYS